MLYLHLQAPFAAFRTFTAGSFRPTSEFLTPSAAYGLLLNIAGIEMRYDDGKSAMTLIKPDLPKFMLAMGALSFPFQHTIYQQLHNYPVGNTGQEHAETTKGSKYNITPIRRAFLSGLDAYVCIKGNDDIEQQIREGLNGRVLREYGLPFLGDNNFLLDRLEPVSEVKAARWYVPFAEGGLSERVTRLTISINRSDMAQTKSKLFRPIENATSQIPDDAWVEVGY